MDKTVYISDIKDELQKIRDELDSLEEKLRSGQVREALRLLGFIIDDVDALMDDLERYDPWNDIDDEEVAETCHEMGCECPSG
jgi:methionyl-tRNA synthetase